MTSRSTSNNHIIFSLLLIIASLIFFSCNPREEREIRHMIGQNIDIEGTFLYLDSSQIYKLIPSEKPIKVMTFIDYNNCYECMFKPLFRFEAILANNNIKSDEINILAFVDSIDTTKAQEILKKIHLSRTVIVVDSAGYYLKKNNLEKLLHRNRTFILDKNNEIVFMGNPVITYTLQPNFCKILSNLSRNNGVFREEVDRCK